MELTTTIQVQKIRVIADYQRKENNPMFEAILRYAYENQSEITVEEAKNKLSGVALTTRMWENIFDRLIAQDYFEKTQIIKNEFSRRDEYFFEILGHSMQKTEIINGYKLTEFGEEAAKQNTFFKQMKGELEIWLVKDKITWFPHQVVEIKEVRSSREEIKNGQNTKRFQLPTKQILDLKNASFQLVKFEDKCEVLKKENAILSVKTAEKYGELTVGDLSFAKRNFSKTLLQGNFLSQKYGQNFQQRSQVVRIPFDENIQFQRTVQIKKPVIEGIEFNSISLKNINFMAKTEADAEAWRLKWMSANVRDYIFENSEFKKLVDKIWLKFQPYYKLSHLTMTDFENHLKEDEIANFYSLMKLQAPQLLTY